MKNSWIYWVLGVGIVVAVFIAFNYQGEKKTASLSEIFPEDQASPVDVEYEFVEEGEPTIAAPAAAVKTDSAKTSVVLPSTTLPGIAETSAPSVETVTTAIPGLPGTVAPALTDISQIAYTIQIFSFSDQAKADKALSEVTKKGLDAFVAAKEVPGKGMWYRVYAGKFDAKKDADTYLAQVKGHYPNSFVIALKK